MRFKCFVCDKTYAFSSGSSKHEKTHENVSCFHGGCDYNAPTVSLLRAHVKLHKRIPTRLSKGTHKQLITHF